MVRARAVGTPAAEHDLLRGEGFSTLSIQRRPKTRSEKGTFSDAIPFGEAVGERNAPDLKTTRSGFLAA